MTYTGHNPVPVLAGRKYIVDSSYMYIELYRKKL